MSEKILPRKIMVIEDNQLNQKIANMIIEQIGHDSIQVFDGEKAVEITKKEKPDLIILDIQLGDISGIDVAKEIRSYKELKSIPIIVVTVLGTEEEKKQIIKDSGCNDYIAKPFLPNVFVDAIAKYIPVKSIDWALPNNK
jgi:two-component system cell cycle response regulator DivK